MENIEKILDDIKGEQSKIRERLTAVEFSGAEGPGDHSYARRTAGLQHNAIPHGSGGEGRQNGRRRTENFAIPELDDIQQEFTIIKDSLQKIRLSKDLKVEDSRQGVRRGDQGQINNISKCARYSETVLKLLSSLDCVSISEGDINDLLIIHVAMIRYLQEEHALVHVGGSFGDNVEKIYRNFRRNTSVFDSQAIESLQAAVTLDAAQPNQVNQGFRGRGRFGYQSNYRGRGRGAYNSVYRFNRNLQGGNQFQTYNQQASSGNQSNNADMF